MQRAAGRLDFEKAALLRDEIIALKDVLLKYGSGHEPPEDGFCRLWSMN